MTEAAHKTASSWRRVLKWCGLGLAGLLALVVLLVGGLFAFLRTDAGLDRLTRVVEAAVSSERVTLSIGRLDGPFPERLKAVDVKLSDAQGDLIALQSAEFAWRPLDLLEGRLEVTRLHLNGVDVNRLPEGGEEEADAETETEPPGLPELPLDVVVRDVRIAPLRLGAAVVGLPDPLALALGAELTALRSQAYSVSLEVERLDGVPTRLSADASFDAARDWLRVAVRGSEPAGGLLASFLDLPNRPAIRVDAQGEGPLEAWNGRLEAVAEDTASIALDVRLSGKAPLNIVVDGHAEGQRALPEAARPMLAGGIDIKMNADAGRERIEVHSLEIVSAAGTLRGAAIFLPEDQRVEGSARLALGAAETFRGLGLDVTYEEAAADLRFAGVLPELKVNLDARARALSSGGFQAGDLALTAGVEPKRSVAGGAVPPFDFAIEVSAADVLSPDQGLNTLLQEPVRLSVTGGVTPDQSEGTIDKLVLTAGPITLHGTGEAFFGGTPTGSARLHTEPIDLVRFSSLAGEQLSGQAALQVDLDVPAANEIHGTLSAAIEGFSSDNPGLAALVGTTLNLDADVKQTAEAGIVFDAELANASIRLTADGSLSSDLALINKANLKIIAEDLSRFKSLAPGLDGGEMHIEASAEGPVDDFSGRLRLTGNGIAYQMQRIEHVLLTVSASGIPNQAEGSVSLKAKSSMGSLAVDSPFAVVEAARLRLAKLTLEYENAVSVIGDLTIPFDGKPIIGEATLRSEQLEPIGKRFAVPLGGGLRLDARLSGDDGVQRIRADLRGTRLRYGDPASPTAEVERLQATLDAIDPAASRRVSLAAVADQISVGGGNLVKTTLDVSGAGDRFEIRAETSGDLQGLTHLDTAAEVGLADGLQVVVRSLNALLKGEQLRLLKPARIVAAGDRIELDDLALSYGSARAEATLLKDPREVAGHVTLRGFNLAMLDRFVPAAGLRGQVDADVTLSGTPRAPRLRLETTASDLGSRDVDPKGAGASVDAEVTGELIEGRARIEIAVEGLGETPLTSKLEVPVRFAIEPFQFAVVEDGVMSGSLAWRGEVGPLFRLLPIDMMLVGGLAEIDVTLSGTPASPAPAGKISLTRGSLEYFETGTVLRPLDLEILVEREEMRIARLDAGDAGSGRLSGRGSVGLSAPIRVDFGLDIDNAVLVRRDDITSRLSGTVGFTGAIGERGDLRARIRNEATEIRLVDRLPPTVKTLDVVYASETKNEGGEQGAAEAPSTLEPWLFLDIEVDMPDRVFIRGRGLESEWGGEAKVKGSADAPDVQARLSPLRGDFSLFGKVFKLEEGEVSVNGLDQEIRIDLTASYKSRGFKALIVVSGTASQPKLTITSEPELPQDEILARMLFDKHSGQLTPAEAAQLASAAATLASGEAGMLDKLREATGLDRLTVGAGSEEAGLATVEAGRYVAEGVYVGAEQGAAANSSNVVVEIDITDNIKARSTTSGEGKNTAGIRWEWDY
jgi:translocation and assembly module TamB